jgi:hypothetical protein
MTGIDGDISGRPPSWYYKDNKDTVYELKKKAARRIRSFGKTLNRVFTDVQKKEEEELNKERYKFADTSSGPHSSTSGPAQ